MILTLSQDHPNNPINRKKGLKGFSGVHFRVLTDRVFDEQLHELNRDGLFEMAKASFGRCSGEGEDDKGMIKLGLLRRIHRYAARKGLWFHSGSFCEDLSRLVSS